MAPASVWDSALSERALKYQAIGYSDFSVRLLAIVLSLTSLACQMLGYDAAEGTLTVVAEGRPRRIHGCCSRALRSAG
jgi:hypothetical protein